VSSDLGFAVGPRINAAGRLEDMSVGIECLLTDDPVVAGRHAAALDEINKTRREIESTMREQAFTYVESLERRKWPSCVCVFDGSWHQGVVGLVAARVREKCHRPAIAFAREGDGWLKGSARSIAGVHARDLLEAVSSRYPGLIVKFGGHAMAAGLTIAEEHYDDFADAVTEQAKRLYPDADFSGAIVTDGVISADDIARWGGLLQGARALREAGPWGAGFPEPTWSGDFELLEQRTVGENHLKMRLRPVSGETVVDAIAFNQAGPAYRGIVQLAYRLDVNEWQGRESPQLIVEQIAALQAGGA
jgi:single-stranded-DNA-specific exonuclease